MNADTKSYIAATLEGRASRKIAGVSMIFLSGLLVGWCLDAHVRGALLLNSGDVGRGTMQSGLSGQNPKVSKALAHGRSDLEHAAARFAAGQSIFPWAETPASPAEIAGNIVSAPDFTYDETGLPHYPESVQRVASAMAYQGSDTSSYITSVAIETGDSLETVSAWYRVRLSGWHERAVGDPAVFGRQTTSLAGGLRQIPSSPKPGDRLQVTEFEPQRASLRSVITIVKQGDELVEVMMRASHDPSRP